MEDKLQDLADKFCQRFRLKPVEIPFMAMPRKLFQIWEFLLPGVSFWKFVHARKKGKVERELQEAEKMGKVALAATKKRILWKYMIENKRINWGAGFIGPDTLLPLEAAIKICDGKLPNDRNLIKQKFPGADVEDVVNIVNRIREHHAKGMVIYEFRELHDFLNRELRRGGRIVKKLPLFEGDKYLEKYFHEAIHFILIVPNGICDFSEQHEVFDEGLCTYLHKRFRGWWHRFGTWRFYRGHVYLQYEKYFKYRLDKIPDMEIGPFLKENLKALINECKKYEGAA